LNSAPNKTSPSKNLTKINLVASVTLSNNNIDYKCLSDKLSKIFNKNKYKKQKYIVIFLTFEQYGTKILENNDFVTIIKMDILDLIELIKSDNETKTNNYFKIHNSIEKQVRWELASKFNNIIINHLLQKFEFIAYNTSDQEHRKKYEVIYNLKGVTWKTLLTSLKIADINVLPGEKHILSSAHLSLSRFLFYLETPKLEGEKRLGYENLQILKKMTP